MTPASAPRRQLGMGETPQSVACHSLRAAGRFSGVTRTARRLVGRERELDALRGALERAAQGAGCVRIVGEPGIGKTTLLRELVDAASERGDLVLSGRGAEFEQERPFGVFVDALDDYLGSLHPERLERLGGGRAAELAGVFPSLASLAPELSAPAPLEAERDCTHRAVRACSSGSRPAACWS